MALLTLRLEGVLQSWGSDARWDFRGTDLFPTKSGVVGLIGCAMGLASDDPLLAELSTVLRMGTRIDRAGKRLQDFQTVTGHPLRAATGSQRANGQTIISRREYVSDASYFVVLEGPPEVLETIANALDDPKWPYYLGRKSCPPSRPVHEPAAEQYAEIMDALRRHPLAERHDDGPQYAYEIEKSSGDGVQLNRSDERAHGAGRGSAMRSVTRGEVTHVSHQA